MQFIEVEKSTEVKENVLVTEAENFPIAEVENTLVTEVTIFPACGQESQQSCMSKPTKSAHNESHLEESGQEELVTVESKPKISRCRRPRLKGARVRSSRARQRRRGTVEGHEGSQIRTASAPMEAEARVKKPKKRWPRSGYVKVKDQWFYMPC